MHPSNLLKLFSITLITFFVLTISFQANSASKTKQEADVSGKDRLVLMPLRVPPEDRDLTGAMETALVEGLQQKYIVFSGEQVSQKAREIFLKETRNTAHKECDETKCMQNIAMAFQAELLATANVTKHDGIYYLALSVQNIFDNKVEYSKTLTCEICNGAKVIEKLKTLSGVISSGAPDTAEDEYQKEAVRKQRAEQLKKEQQEFEAKLKNADAAERKRLLDAKAADDKRLAELKAAAEARRKNNQAQPTTFPPLELAQTEITKLTDKIAAIETGYEKELADTRKQVKQRYADKLDALENEKRDEFESKDEFRTKQEKKHNELISQRDAELARLNVATIADADTAPLKARIKALTEHVYPVGADGIETELGSYDSDEHQFSIKMRSKNSILKLKLNSTIPLQGSEAKAFKQQWQTGLVRPEAKANFNGDLVEVALLNDADNSRLILYEGGFKTSEAIAAATELKLWNTADISNSKVALESYISQYPNGRYFAEANAKFKLIKEGYVIQGGLIWIQINSSRKTDANDSQISGLLGLGLNSSGMNWSDANAYCSNTAINGQYGWRLPTKKELVAFYKSGALKDQEWSHLFWSSTPENDGNHYWVTLHNGDVGAVTDTYSNHVTCVR
jgi:hypothetical protein